MSTLRLSCCAPLCAFVTILLAFFSKFVVAEVGVPSAEGTSVDRWDVLTSGMWSLGSDGCRLGRPGNLVVTPRPGSTLEGGQVLDPYFTGSHLCSWLSMMEQAHSSIRPAWEHEHERQGQTIPRWNLWKRFSHWKKTFPQLEISVQVRYLHLWDKDRFGHPLPWATVLFRYACPDKDSSYGLFQHLCGSVFSQSADSRVPTEVSILLKPRPGFNKPLDVSASKWQFVTGAISGLTQGEEEEQEEVGGIALLQSFIARSSAFTTLHGTINDCWMYHGSCYFRWLLKMEWRLFGETFCERVHRQANGDVGSAMKSAALDSVKVHVFGLDLFSSSRPRLFGTADEGVLGINEHSGLLTMEVDTTPENIPNFERAKTTAKNVRTANMLFKGVSTLLQHKQGKKSEAEQ